MAETVSISKPRTPCDQRRIENHNVINEILLKLPDDEFDLILPRLEFVRLKADTLLQEACEQIKSAYFVNGGIQSIITVQPEGKSVEVAQIGKEGFVGMPIVDGFRRSPVRVISQGDGTACRMDANAFRRILSRCPKLERDLHRFGQLLAMQSMQIAACNGLHSVEQRLARCLLMSRDHSGKDELVMTQEVLSQKLGVRQAGISVAAGLLQKAGIIAYTRGKVTILNRRKLEAASCSCYLVIRSYLPKWYAEAS